MPQGYTESPAFFFFSLQNLKIEVPFPPDSSLPQPVDDIHRPPLAEAVLEGTLHFL